MAQLLLKGRPIGNVQGVLFDKDGTLSHSEPHLLALADARIRTAIKIAQKQAPALQANALSETLRRAFGVHNGLAGHTAAGILGQQSIQNGVAHLVADLVGMPFGD